jgi:DNA modification methylase
MNLVKILSQKITDEYSIYHGDSVEVLKGIPDNSIGYSIFSPPFGTLFIYSNSGRDIGNCVNDNEFFEHFRYMVPELYRITMPGRNLSFHIMNTNCTIGKEGFIGLKDLRGDLIRMFLGDSSVLVPAILSLKKRQNDAIIDKDYNRVDRISQSISNIEKEMEDHSDSGFIFHSEVTIWKDPAIEALRTKSLRLAHKQIVKDSSRCGIGGADYIITMRKPGKNSNPIEHPDGLKEYYGDDEPNGKYDLNPRYNKQSQLIWRKFASPVWMDIRQTHTLQTKEAKEVDDEPHVCPLQIDTVNRCLELWSKEGDIVLDPFAGIGTVPYCAIQKKRKTIGIELKESYFKQMKINCKKAKKTGITKFGKRS